MHRGITPTRAELSDNFFKITVGNTPPIVKMYLQVDFVEKHTW